MIQFSKEDRKVSIDIGRGKVIDKLTINRRCKKIYPKLLTDGTPAKCDIWGEQRERLSLFIFALFYKS